MHTDIGKKQEDWRRSKWAFKGYVVKKTLHILFTPVFKIVF